MVSFLAPHRINGNKMSGPAMPVTKPKRGSSNTEDDQEQSKRFIDAARKAEADETELAKSRKTKRPAGFRRRTHNPKVMSLVERGGNIRSVTLDHRGVGKHLRALVHQDSRLVTDKAQHYKFRG